MDQLFINPSNQSLMIYMMIYRRLYAINGKVDMGKNISLLYNFLKYVNDYQLLLSETNNMEYAARIQTQIQCSFKSLER